MKGRRGNCAVALLTTIFALPAVLLAPSNVLGGQTGQISQEPLNDTLHVHADLIYVPVTVTDAEGKPVSGLQRQDFLLTEDGHPETIRLFEQPASRPLSVVLAMDTSLSVEKDLDLEKHAARDFIQTLLRKNDLLELLGFAGHVTEFVPFTNDAGRIDHGLNGLRGHGPTALYAAIDEGAVQLQTLPGRRIIVVISDGGNSMPGVDYQQARAAAMRAEASIESIIILPIAASAGRNLGGEHALIQLSHDTGGQYFYVRAGQQLPAALAQLSTALRSEYLLGYYAGQHIAKGDPGPGNFHSIHVEMKDAAWNQRFHLHFRSGYAMEQEH